MINYLKQNHLALLALALLLVLWVKLPSSTPLGAITIKENGKDVVNITNPIHLNDRATFDASTTAASSFKIGQLGTSTTQVLAGKLTQTAGLLGNRSLTATTSGAFDFAVTGVISGDVVQVLAASTTAAAGGAFLITGCSASTTAGFVTCAIENFSGANNVIPYAIASATQFIIWR